MRESVCCNNWYGEDDGDGFGKETSMEWYYGYVGEGVVAVLVWKGEMRVRDCVLFCVYSILHRWYM